VTPADGTRVNKILRSVGAAFRAVMDSAPVAVLAAGEDGYYIYGNRTAQNLLGYDMDQLRRTLVADLLEADPQWFEQEFDRFKREQAWSGRLLLRRRSGGVVKVAVNAFVASLPDGGVEYVGLSHPARPDDPDLERLPCTGFQYGLTARDIRLLQLVAEGFANKEVASILGIHTVAVDNGLRAIFQKMNASSRTEACVLALKAHIIL
jgi:PAS domain S-box-containing protein